MTLSMKFTDNALTTLATGIGVSDTQLTVLAGKGDNFPAVTNGTDFFVLTLENASHQTEQIQCFHRSAGQDVMGSVTYPLVRGYNGTVARTWNAGDIVDLRWNTASVSALQIDIAATYETQTHASATYETQSHAATTYQPVLTTASVVALGTTQISSLSVASLTGIAKLTAGAVGTAVAGTDYQAPLTTASSIALGTAQISSLSVASLSGVLKATAGAVSAATAGTDFAKPATASSWTATQTVTPSALTHNTGWDASAIQNATVNVNGSSFTIANPSVNCATGTYIAIYVTYTTTHSVAWGANFKNVATITPTATAGKQDFFLFRYTGTNYECVGYTLDTGKA